MDDSAVVDALVMKRGELVDRTTSLERALEEARADIVHIDATVRLFSPGGPVAPLPSKCHRPHARLFRQPELSRLLLKLLREDSSMAATDDLARKVMIVKTLPMDDPAVYTSVKQSVSSSLTKLKKRGIVLRVQEDGLSSWTLASRR